MKTLTLSSAGWVMDVAGVRTFVRGDAAPDTWPSSRIGISLRLAAGTFSIDGPSVCSVRLISADVVLSVDQNVCRRTFGIEPSSLEAFHLPTDMRAMGVSILGCGLPGDAKRAFYLAKSIELLCSISEKILSHALVAKGKGEYLSELDTRRIMTARRIIDERWQEKLTLAFIARGAGINRAKLTRGFRSMFACSVADAIAEQRMNGARNLILATDLSIASIGYRCGYLNNASFARAFSRRFGLAPTRMRADRIAA